MDFEIARLALQGRVYFLGVFDGKQLTGFD